MKWLYIALLVCVAFLAFDKIMLLIDRVRRWINHRRERP